MMKRATRSIFMAAVLSANLAFGQTVHLRELFFNDFITFYISSVDVSTGASNMDLFELEISPVGNDPVRVVVEFKIVINSASLGLTFNDLFLTVTTDPFDLLGSVRVQNRELNTSISGFPYTDQPGRVEISGANIQSVDFDELENMLSQIIQTGRLPDGTYRFSLDVQDPNSGLSLLDTGPWEKVIISAHPVALELITPGGFLDDTTNTTITTTYPFFQWESDPCAICTYFIRVAQFIPGEHSTVEDAVEDLTVLPLDQAAGFVEVGNATSYQYPLAGAADLEPGRVYVWQVQKSIPTTERDEFVNSFIYAFKVLDPTASPATGAGVIQDPILRFLQSVMGADQYEITFSAGGDLAGFTPTNTIILNGEPGDLNDLSNLSSAVDQGAASIISVEVE